ncbi:hypothetical protein [Nannocystis pusilla]|uniref:hypothetical protein n=1 Tax=Nannocystis pusilla TaxID=889268 RepID=UPI003BF2B8DB
MSVRVLNKVCSLGVTAMFGACASEPEGELELRDDTGCPDCGNGSNSAHANEYPIDKLSLSSYPNEAGITVTGIEDPLGTIYWLATVGDDFDLPEQPAAGDAPRGRGPLHLADLHAADGDDGAARVDELALA